MIEKHLMSLDDYLKTGHQVPYSYSIEKNGQTLYYFGAHHSMDPKDPQFETLKKFWSEFLVKVKTAETAGKTDKKKAIVFVEGGKRQVWSSESEAIERGGEPEFITFLAAREDIETFSPEPPEPLRFQLLEKKFSHEEIAFYEFARMSLQWTRFSTVKPDYKRYIEDSLKADQENSGWTDVDPSLENMIVLQKKLFNREFDKNDGQFYYDAINPTTSSSRINELSRFEDSGLRDVYILQQIEKYWNEGTDIFIVYGASHAVMHEPAARKLL